MSYKNFQSGLENLSTRKRQILDKLVLGYNETNIAQELGIEPGTVRTYVNKIYNDLGIKKNSGGRRKHLEAMNELINLMVTHAPSAIIDLGLDSIPSALKDKLYTQHQLPKGAIPISSPFYVKRSSDQTLEKMFADTSNFQLNKIVTIKGSKGVGKTSLLVRLFYLLQSKNSLVRSVDLNDVSELNNDTSLNNLEIFLKEFTNLIKRSFGKNINSSTKPFSHYWEEKIREDITIGKICTNYLNDYIFSNIDKPTYLLIDGMDIVFNKPVQRDFEVLIRSWSQNQLGSPREKGIWPNIIITYSTLSCVIEGISSPLANCGIDVNLKEFNQEEVKILSSQYGLKLNEHEIYEIMDLLGGKPELIQTAFQHILKNKINIDKLLNNADKLDGPFREYLSHLCPLKKMPQLINPFKRILDGEKMINPEIQFQLEKTGLIKIKDGAPVVACRLLENYYKSYFGASND